MSIVAAILAAATLHISDHFWQITPHHHRHHRHHHHRPKPKPKAKPDPPPLQTAVASWYAEHGTGACGVGDVQSGFRFASLFLRCGTRVEFCHRGCVVAVMSDHGPYVGGRTFDLNWNLKNAIGCSDICTVQWRLAS